MSLNSNTTLVRSQVKGATAILRFLGTSANVIVSGNSSVNADIANPGNDAVTGATIRGLVYCVAGNTVSLQRQNSTVNTTVLTIAPGAAALTQSQGWMGDQQLPSQNLVVTFGTGAAGFIDLELSKTYASGNPPLD